MGNFEPLSRSFYKPTAEAVAPALLGHYLIRHSEGAFCGGLIVETEAYLMDDPACHASRGITPRNQTMFGPPGHAYVYMIYGFYFCVNAVCQPHGVAEAVLIRAVEPVFGEAQMRSRRPVKTTHALTSGPGKLCQALDITRGLDGVDLCRADSPLFIGRNPDAEEIRHERGPMLKTTRIGITKAAGLPLRFHLPGSLFVSRR